MLVWSPLLPMRETADHSRRGALDDRPDKLRHAAGVMTSMHIPIRPGWMCAGCGRDYPCTTRRGQLRAEFEGAPISLALLMSAYFVEAAEDLPTTPSGALYRRFLGWMR